MQAVKLSYANQNTIPFNFGRTDGGRTEDSIGDIEVMVRLQTYSNIPGWRKQ